MANKNDRCLFLPFHIGRQNIQSVLNVFNPLLDVPAQHLDHTLILRFPGRAFFQHSEEQVDVQCRPNSLLKRNLQNTFKTHIHIITSFLWIYPDKKEPMALRCLLLQWNHLLFQSRKAMDESPQPFYNLILIYNNLA